MCRWNMGGHKIDQVDAKWNKRAYWMNVKGLRGYCKHEF